MNPPSVVLAASEGVPYAKTGGLADVTGALSVELRRKGLDAALIMPLYSSVRAAGQAEPLAKRIRVRVGNEDLRAGLWRAEGRAGLPVYFIENDRLFAREGLYGDHRGDYPDNASRFVFFSRAVLESIRILGLEPAVIHCNDWQTGLIPLYVKSLYRSSFPDLKTVFTIHNLGYQGVFWHYDMPLLGVGWEYFGVDGLEFYGKINFMKAGIVFGDRITTVSPTYAKEIQTPDGGFGLDGVLRMRSERIAGVLNGLDTEEWNPGTDLRIPETYTADDLKGKATCRTALRRECGLEAKPGVPLLSVVARMSEQKGIDLVLRAAKRFAASRVAQMVILGSGDAVIERQALELAEAHKGYLHVRIGFDEGLAHRIYAGSDIFLMPSRYEPCGLGQMIAMRYGTVPVVRKTGGLADTVRERGRTRNGYVFSGSSADSFLNAVARALSAFSSDTEDWRFRIGNGMKQDYTWSRRAEDYVSLYRSLAGEGTGVGKV